MKKTTRPGLIVLILMLVGMGLYTAYTIFRMNGGRLFRSVTSTETYRVAEDSDTYDSITAKEYKKNFNKIRINMKKKWPNLIMRMMKQ